MTALSSTHDAYQKSMVYTETGMLFLCTRHYSSIGLLLRRTLVHFIAMRRQTGEMKRPTITL